MSEDFGCNICQKAYEVYKSYGIRMFNSPSSSSDINLCRDCIRSELGEQYHNMLTNRNPSDVGAYCPVCSNDLSSSTDNNGHITWVDHIDIGNVISFCLDCYDDVATPELTPKYSKEKAYTNYPIVNSSLHEIESVREITLLSYEAMDDCVEIGYQGQRREIKRSWVYETKDCKELVSPDRLLELPATRGYR